MIDINRHAIKVFPSSRKEGKKNLEGFFKNNFRGRKLYISVKNKTRAPRLYINNNMPLYEVFLYADIYFINEKGIIRGIVNDLLYK